MELSPPPLVTAAIQPVPLVALALTGAAYALRAHTLATEDRSVPPARQASFWLGLLIVAVAVYSPLGTSDDKSLIAHTAVHMLIGQIGAFFIVVGLTGPLIAPLLRIGWVAKLRWVSSPQVALPFWALNLFLWHTPVLFEAAVQNDFVHALQHGMFLAAGINLWMPLFGPLPQPSWFGNFAKLVYVVLAFFAMMILGNVLVWSGSVFYDTYAESGAFWGLKPLASQSIAGAIMMAVDTAFTVFLFAWLFMRAAHESEEAQRLVEYGRERGVELSPDRTARAAAAGTGDLLRERVERERH